VKTARKFLRRAVLFSAAMVLLAMTADFAYARVTGSRLDQWQRAAAWGADGVRKGCESFSVGSGRTALLLVHGFGASPAIFSRMAPALAARGFACHAMRLPGYGERVQSYALATRADWRRALSDELSALRRDHASVWVVAHSMGGTLAVSELLEHPDAADGVVLLAPLLGVNSRRCLGIPPEALFHVARGALRYTRIFETCFPMDVRDPELAAFDARDRFVPEPVYAEMFDLLDEVRGSERVFTKPLLLVLSRNDRVVDAAPAEAFFARAAGPAKRLVYADQAGHAIPLDIGWEGVVAQIDDFVAGHE
jgi:alpha-beta hydrolase superfamily lysophospholipase